jgi:hypothetical protein
MKKADGIGIFCQMAVMLGNDTISTPVWFFSTLKRKFSTPII